MKDEVLFKNEVGRMEILIVDNKIVLKNPLLDDYSIEEIGHYEKVVEKDF